MRRALLATVLFVGLGAVPAQAYIISPIHTESGDQAQITADGCKITKNADHSVSVRCPSGHWATFTWTEVGRGPVSSTTVDCVLHACARAPQVADLGRIPGVGGSLHAYSVTQQVHHNRIASMTITLS